MKNLVPQILYRVFNLINKNQLNFHYNNVKKVNENKESTVKNVEEYLKLWNRNPDILNNEIMYKSDVLKDTQLVPKEKIHSFAYTGGSYGEPLRIPYSKNRGFIRTATFKYFNEFGGYKLGDAFVLIRAKSKSALEKFLRNENIFIPNDISEKKIKEFITLLKSKKIKVLMGYPSVIFELALYLKKNPAELEGLKIKSIISVSEPLEDYKREIIHDVIKASFVDRYSNEEVGLIAQQKEFGGEYFVNRYGVFVEILNPETNEPVAEGEQGKVIVTDYHNDLIPIIRYDTGDFAQAYKYVDGQLFSIAKIAGRVTEQIFSTNGTPISSLMLGPYIYKPLSEEGQVYQYQFAQIDTKRYELRIKANASDLSEKLIQKLKDGLLQFLGEDANLQIKTVEDIKPQPSGKRPVFKNEM